MKVGISPFLGLLQPSGRRSVFLGVIGVLWGAPILMGEEVPVTLDEVVVSEKTNGSEEATKNLKQLAGGVTVVDLERFKQGASVSMADSLQFVPGVYARSRNQSAQARLSIRGSGAARNSDVRGIALQLNGLPLNGADADSDYLTAIEPLSLSQIHVIRSANATGSVSNHLGGSIDFITHTGRTAPRGWIQAQFGSHDFYRQHAMSGWTSGAWDGFVDIDQLTSDGEREQNQQSRQHFDLNLGWQGGDFENRLYLTRVQSDEELPGALTNAQMSQNSTQSAPNTNPLFDRRLADWRDRVKWNRVADRFAWKGDDVQVSGGAWVSYAEVKNPRNQVFDFFYHDAGTRLELKREDEIAGHGNQFTAMLTPVYAWEQDAVYRNLGGGVRGAPVDRTRSEWMNVDLFLQDRFEIIESLHGILSLSGGYASRALQDQVVLSNERGTHDQVDYVTWAPALGMVYDWSPEIQIYGNAVRSEEPPTMRDLYQQGSSDFVGQRTQTASTLEIGARGEQGRWGWDGAIYRSWLKNEFLISETFPGAGDTVTRNAERSTRLGVESGLTTELLAESLQVKREDSLKWAQTFTWNDFEITRDPLYANRALPGIPEYLIQEELMYRNPSGFYSGPNVQVQPEGIWVDYDNTVKSDSFAIFGWKMGYLSARGLELFLEVENMTDERYAKEISVIGNAAGLDQRVYFPGGGRSFYCGVAWRW